MMLNVFGFPKPPTAMDAVFWTGAAIVWSAAGVLLILAWRRPRLKLKSAIFGEDP